MLGRRSGSSKGLPQLVAVTQPRSAAAEAYRSVRTNLQFSGLDEPVRTLVVTSAAAGEGKTTTAANFAIVSAQGGVRVCLIDSDLRRPALHKLFGLPNERGLTTALVEGLTAAAVAQPTAVPQLSVVTSGALPPNPAEMAASRRMGDLLAKARAEFDLVVCDTPPVVSVSDGVALAAQCDGVLLVVRAATVPHDVVSRAIEQIEAVRGRIVGVLLNDINLRRNGYDYPYYRYARSYYSSSNGKP
jgi:non-specific protein-tyrosine kinase